MFFFPLGKISTYPELDEEIDFLSAVISEQRTESRLPGTVQNITLYYLLTHTHVYIPPCHCCHHNPSFIISAPPSQDVSIPKSKLLSKSSPTFRTSTTEQPTSRSMSFTSTPKTANTTNTNHIPAVLRGPIILPYPSSDYVFISKSYLSLYFVRFKLFKTNQVAEL